MQPVWRPSLTFAFSSNSMSVSPVLRFSKFSTVSMGGEAIGALFDFGNPIPANRDPLEDLYEMRDVIRGAHSKDVIVIPEARGRSCVGVSLGQGDLPLAKMYFDLLMLGEDTPQLEFMAVQSVSGYIAPSGRLRDESSSRVFDAKTASATPMAAMEPERRLARERQDAQQHFESAKLLVNHLQSFATEAVGASDTAVTLGPEAAHARAIEDIGRQLYGDPERKRIWQTIQTTDGAELEGTLLSQKEARALVTLATNKHRELINGCV
jgi:hypothetical protein